MLQFWGGGGRGRSHSTWGQTQVSQKPSGPSLALHVGGGGPREPEAITPSGRCSALPEDHETRRNTLWALPPGSTAQRQLCRDERGAQDIPFRVVTHRPRRPQTLSQLRSPARLSTSAPRASSGQSILGASKTWVGEQKRARPPGVFLTGSLLSHDKHPELEKKRRKR